MAFDLHPDSVEVARLALAAALGRMGGNVPPVKIGEALARVVIRAYLTDAEGRQPKNAHRIKPQTKALMAMKVGDVLTAKLETSATWCSRMATVRRRLGNPEMRWTIDLAEGGSVITRLPDGASTLRPHYSGMTKALSAMALWETISRPETRLETGQKNSARSLMGEPLADWKRELTNKGLRITRIK
jgi:hypothetical protein